MSAPHAVVIGGSVAGLGAALALSQRDYRVTILESDATPLPEGPEEAFSSWKRKGSPQTRHSHALLARLRNLLREHAPDLLSELLSHGAEELRFSDRARELFGEDCLEPGDEDLVALACRRITFEWVLRRHVLDSGRVEFRDGVKVLGLRAEGGVPPRVTGVEIAGAGGLDADVVIDATGRRTRLGEWLPAIGTAEVPSETSDCGIFYTSRFYRLRPGVEPPRLSGGIVGVDLGYLKMGVFAGDSRVFSITMAASPEDEAMGRIRRQPCFDIAAEAIPLSAQWISPELAEPITGVHAMAGLTNARRRLVVDGEPLALGFFAVGDSQIHTNPIVGRGCSLGWVQAFDLAASLDENRSDLRAAALAYESCVESNVLPWYLIQVTQDADAVDVARSQLRGENPFEEKNPDGSANPRGFMRSLLRDGLAPGLEEDVHLMRAFSRTIHLLDAPGDLMKNPDVMRRILEAYGRRDDRPARNVGPRRDDLLGRFEEAA
jgi:hypothetical protein